MLNSAAALLRSQVFDSKDGGKAKFDAIDESLASLGEAARTNRLRKHAAKRAPQPPATRRGHP